MWFIDGINALVDYIWYLAGIWVAGYSAWTIIRKTAFRIREGYWS